MKKSLITLLGLSTMMTLIVQGAPTGQLPANIQVGGQPFVNGATCVTTHFKVTWTPTDHSKLSMAQLIDLETGKVIVDRVQASTPVLDFYDLDLDHRYRFQVRNYTAHEDPWAVVNFRTVCNLTPPKISGVPILTGGGCGDRAVFSVKVTHSTAIHYQWLRDAVEIAGAIAPTFTIPSVGPTDQGSYSVRVSDCCSEVSSHGTRLVVPGAPVITTQPPQDVRVCLSDGARLGVVAQTSIAATYRWMHDGVAVGGNSATLDLGSVTDASAGIYTVVVQNACGSIESNPTRVTVLHPPSVRITTTAPGLCLGDPFEIQSTVAGDPPLSYQWFFNGMLIQGANKGSLIIGQMTPANSGTYSLKACNGCGCSVSQPIVCHVSQPPIITQDPFELRLVEGDKATFGVTAASDSLLEYQWLKNGVLIPNATGPSFTIPAVRRSDAAGYSVRVSNKCGPVTSATASLFVSARCSLSGYIWNDANTNGVWDRFLSTPNPDVVFVLDKSTSTLDPFRGTPVGDFNHDGTQNSILDAELAAFEVLNSALIRRGLGHTARVSLVEFANTAIVPDMEPGTPGVQSFTTPDTDSDGNGVPDVIDVLRKVRAQSGTNFRDGLRVANALFELMKTPTGSGNLVFLSDGFPNAGGAFTTEVDALRSKGVGLKAFGVGTGARLSDLSKMDAKAQIVTSTDELIGVFDDLSQGHLLSEPPLSGVVVYLDDDNNGKLGVTERYTVTDTNGFFCFPKLPSGCYHLRQIAPEGYNEVVPGSAGDHEICLAVGGGENTRNFGDKARNRFSFPKVQGEVLEFTYAADVGVSWRVDRSTDLIHWTAITNIIGGDYGVTIRDIRKPAEPHVFYRNIRE